MFQLFFWICSKIDKFAECKNIVFYRAKYPINIWPFVTITLLSALSIYIFLCVNCFSEFVAKWISLHNATNIVLYRAKYPINCWPFVTITLPR